MLVLWKSKEFDEALTRQIKTKINQKYPYQKWKEIHHYRSIRHWYLCKYHKTLHQIIEQFGWMDQFLEKHWPKLK